ncbi:hypothetical protein M9H77_07638 [Catharanthus roseus]|uniref:Uncharacterized protein n=1 Tax=Catharanthus roseus TaxID=4058 RepID=A0ACC0BVI2_CATRO|nr:hypothetical protein M9H77_07638 [Catharanthus roseus]
MVRHSGYRGDDDLSPVTNRTGRVEGRTITASSRGTVYDPYLNAPTVRPHIPYRSAAQEPLKEFNGQPRQIGVEFFYQMMGTAPQDSSYSTYGHIAIAYGVSSSKPYIGRHSTYRGFEGDRGKRLTGSFMSVISKISGSCNKRLDVAREVPAPTQRRKKVKALD